MKTICVAVFAILASSCCGFSLNGGRKEDVNKGGGTVEKKCKGPIDLALLLDSSNSINKNTWNDVKKFAKKVVDNIGEISENGSHFSVIRYSENAVVDFNFNTFKGKDLNAANIKRAIDALPHMKSSTYMDRALEKADKDVFTVANGMRADKKIRKVIVLLTDGMQTIRLEPFTPLKEASRPLKNKGVQIVTLGVGPDIALSELVSISSSPNHVFSTPGFDGLLGKIEELKPLYPCECYKILDIGIIWDVSNSVRYDGFESSQKVIIDLVEKLHVSPSESHVGIIRYGTTLLNTYNMSDTQTFDAVNETIQGLSMEGNQLGTRTSAALIKAGNDFFKPGTPGNRDNVEDIAILFTDGQTHDGTSGANALYIKDTKTIVIGVGSIWDENENKAAKKELLEFAHNKRENVIIAKNFDQLSVKLDDIIKATCSKD